MSDDLNDTAFSPFTLDEFVTTITLNDALAAKIPRSTYYDWRAGRCDLPLERFVALVRVKGCFLRIVHARDRDALASIKEQRTTQVHRRGVKTEAHDG